MSRSIRKAGVDARDDVVEVFVDQEDGVRNDEVEEETAIAV